MGKLNRFIKANREWLEANEYKVCVICGMNNALFEVHRIHDGKYCYDGQTVLLCSSCMSNQEWFDDLFMAVIK